ncbi:MAG: hypothetical protein R3F59_19160 [Myxococcota bacterium]
MKVVRHRRLVRGLHGAPDREVYEVDLCEVSPDAFVVNFRAHRAGRISEGSRPDLPVPEAQAARIFDRLVAQQISRGFVDAEAEAEAVAEPEAPAGAEPPDDPRAAALVAMLQGERVGWTRDPNVLIWRAGELRIRAAAPVVAAIDPRPIDMRAWNIARALLRMGDPTTIGAARAILDGAWPAWVHAMARHAVAVLAEGRARGVPAPGAGRGARPGARLAESGQVRAAFDALGENAGLLDRLYLVSEPEPFRAFLELAPTRGPGFLGIRRVLKLAEARADGEVWGLLVRKIERDSRAGGDRHRLPNQRLSYAAGGTRRYLRRRSWRILRRLGEAGLGEDYVAMATGLLLAYRDELGQPAAPASGSRRRLRARLRSGPQLLFARDWAFVNVLYANDPRIECDTLRLTARLRGTGGSADGARGEAFPHLWDEAPERLAELLDRSRTLAVHRFAARALRANPDTWPRIPVRRLVGWFSAPYVDTVRLAAEIAVTRYDPEHPDLELVQLLLDCEHAEPRVIAEGWVRADPAPFLGDARFVTALVLSPQPTTRRLALELLTSASLLPEHAAEVVAEVVRTALRAQPDDPRSDLFRDAAAVLVGAFGPIVAALPLEQVADLVRHPVEGVAELGARILLVHAVPAAELPDELLAAAMTSPFAAVRGIGVRLYGQLPDAVLAERFRVLVHLATHAESDVRIGARPIIARLTRSNPGFARVLLAALIPVLCAPGPEGMHRDVLRLLRTDLADALTGIPPALVFRLLRASETSVQELGGELLRTNVDPSEITPAQLAVLANSDVAGVRRTAWLMLRARVDAMRAEPESCSRSSTGAEPTAASRPSHTSRSRSASSTSARGRPGRLRQRARRRAGVRAAPRRPTLRPRGRLALPRPPRAAPVRATCSASRPPGAESQAAGDPERIARLVPFLVGVLAVPNRGRVAKQRVLAFLEGQLADPACAAVLAPVVAELVLTVATSHRARYVAMLADLHRRYPDLAVPLQVVAPEVRGAV